jgi:hypothetical protein
MGFDANETGIRWGRSRSVGKYLARECLPTMDFTIAQVSDSVALGLPADTSLGEPNMRIGSTQGSIPKFAERIVREKFIHLFA